MPDRRACRRAPRAPRPCRAAQCASAGRVAAAREADRRVAAARRSVAGTLVADLFRSDAGAKTPAPPDRPTHRCPHDACALRSPQHPAPPRAAPCAPRAPRRGRGRHLHPRALEGRPGRLRHLRGVGRAARVRGRRLAQAVHDAVGVQAAGVRHRGRGARPRRGARARRRRAERRRVRLDPAAARDEHALRSTDQRRRDRGGRRAARALRRRGVRDHARADERGRRTPSCSPAACTTTRGSGPSGSASQPRAASAAA